jgi:hypothetical protein
MGNVCIHALPHAPSPFHLCAKQPANTILCMHAVVSTTSRPPSSGTSRTLGYAKESTNRNNLDIAKPSAVEVLGSDLVSRQRLSLNFSLSSLSSLFHAVVFLAIFGNTLCCGILNICMFVMSIQVVQCQHLATLLCHSTAHTVQLLQCLEPASPNDKKKLLERLRQADEELQRTSPTNFHAVKSPLKLETISRTQQPSRTSSPMHTGSTDAGGEVLVSATSNPLRILHSLTAELQNITVERKELEKALFGVKGLVQTFEAERAAWSWCQTLASVSSSSHSRAALASSPNADEQAQILKQECDQLQQMNALQAAKHREAWERAKSEQEALRQCWLRKLDRLSIRLVHKRRVLRLFQNWSERYRAKKSGHELVYQHKVHCCMLCPCIQCEQLPRTEDTTGGDDARQVIPLDDLRASAPRESGAVLDAAETWQRPQFSSNWSFKLNLEPTGDDVVHVQQTLKHLLHLIYLHHPSALAKQSFQPRSPHTSSMSPSVSAISPACMGPAPPRFGGRGGGGRVTIAND